MAYALHFSCFNDGTLLDIFELGCCIPQHQTALVFAAAFVVVWLGASLVTVNAQLLGGNISFFQSVCVLG